MPTENALGLAEVHAALEEELESARVLSAEAVEVARLAELMLALVEARDRLRLLRPDPVAQHLRVHVHAVVRFGESEGLLRALGHEQELDRAAEVALTLAVVRHYEWCAVVRQVRNKDGG